MLTMTPWVRKLLIANVAMFVVVEFGGPFGRSLYDGLSFYPPAIFVRPWTLVSYMFLHAGFMHLLFNMIGLYFFGPRVKTDWVRRDSCGFTSFLGWALRCFTSCLLRSLRSLVLLERCTASFWPLRCIGRASESTFGRSYQLRLGFSLLCLCSDRCMLE